MMGPELTDQQKRKIEGYQLRVNRDYPDLFYDDFLLIPNGSRIILDDISPLGGSPRTDEAVSAIAKASNQYTYLYTRDQLVPSLGDRLHQIFSEVGLGGVACVFPGKGARGVKQALDPKCLMGMEVFEFDIGRRINENGAVAGVITDTRAIAFQEEPRVVVVVDDVIASGATAAYVRDLIDQPDAEFVALSMIMLSPIQNPYWNNTQNWNGERSTGIRGYDRILTPLLYQGQSGIPPVNSLSTLVSNSLKGQTVRQQFVRKHVDDCDMFMDAINILQSNI